MFRKLIPALFLFLCSPLASFAVNAHFDLYGQVMSVISEPAGAAPTRVILGVFDASTGYTWNVVCRRDATIGTCASLHPTQLVTISGDVTRPCVGSYDTNCAEWSVVTITARVYMPPG